MQKYFFGWKRKLGTILLVPLALCLCVWIRSHFVEDEYEYRFSRFDTLVLKNSPQGIHVMRFQSDMQGVAGDSFLIVHAWLLLPLGLLCSYLFLSKPPVNKACAPAPENSV
jgi:hypothetical protein